MRRRAGLLVALAAAASAACTINEMLHDAPPDPRSCPRVLVVPFDDRDGLGRLYARGVASGLRALGLSPVPAEQAEEFLDLKPGAGGLLSAEALAGVRTRTQADSVLFGRVDCGTPGSKAARVSFTLQETSEGRVALQDSFEPKRCGSSMDASAVADGVAASFRREIERHTAEIGP